MPVAHADILDERESLWGALVKSVLFHSAVVAAIVGATWASKGAYERWGDPNSLSGGSVSITPVTGIELAPQQGMINKVANDTESAVPSKPAKVETRREPEPDDAIAIRSKNAKKKKNERAEVAKKYSPVVEPKPNQVYSSTGQAAVSPLFTQAPGSGDIGSGRGSALGARFGWYEQLLREKVARNWRSNEVGLQTAPPVTVGFEILRDGTARNVRVLESSGNFTLDQSCLRAIMQSSPFQALPPQYEHNSVNIEFAFRLRK